MRYVEAKPYLHTPSPPTAVLPLTLGNSAECPEWQHERSKCFLRNLRNPREIKTICEKDTRDTRDTWRKNLRRISCIFTEKSCQTYVAQGEKPIP
jgi:hypothetical protein